MKKLLLFILSMQVISAMARAATITIFDTGVDNSNALLPEGSVDMHYTVSGPITGPTYVGIDQNTLPYIHEDGVSRWINPTMHATDDDPAGLYTYVTTFVLPAGFTNAMLMGQWLSDNEATMTLNGGTVSMTPNNTSSFQAWTPFTINSGFMAGLNTLDFAVTNDLVGPSALRVEFFTASFTPGPAVPDAGSSVTLLCAGLLALGLFARWSRKTRYLESN